MALSDPFSRIEDPRKAVLGKEPPGWKNNYDYTYVRGRKYETTYKSYLLDNHRHTIPNVAVSPITHLIQSFNFIVTLNQFTYGFKEVSGLEITNRTDYIQEGGVNDHQLLVGKPDDNTHTLEFSRGMMIRCNPMLDTAARMAAAMIPDNLARQAALVGLSSLDPQSALEVGPAIGTIDVYDRHKRLSASYTFLSLGMTEWKADSLDANNYDVTIESITIAHTGLFRVPLGAPNTPFGYLGGSSKNNDKAREDAEDAKKKWDDFNDKRKEALADQYDYLNEQADSLKDTKADLERKKAQAEKALKKLQEEYAKLQGAIDAADEAAKEAAEENAERVSEKAESVEKAKEEAAKEASDAAQEGGDAAKENDSADKGAQEAARQDELDAQKAALDEAADRRAENDKQFEGAEEKRQAALDAQKAALEKSAEDRAKSDSEAKEAAEKAHADAKDKAEQVEAEKQSES